MSNDRDAKYNRPQPNDLPTIKELRASQEKGGTYPGTSEQTLNEKFGTFNQGTGIPVEDDKE